MTAFYTDHNCSTRMLNFIYILSVTLISLVVSRFLSHDRKGRGVFAQGSIKREASHSQQLRDVQVSY